MNYQQLYDETLKEFKDKVLKALSGIIEAIIVYGSVAGGEASENSDIDVLVITRDKGIGDKILDISYEIDYQNDYETFIVPIELTPEEIERDIRVGSPFIDEVLRQGVTLYDNGTYRRIRQKVYGAG